METAKPYRVGVVVFDGFATLSLAAAVEPFRAANLLANKTLYEVTYICAGNFAVSSGRAIIQADHRIGESVSVDLLLLVAGSDVGEVPLIQFTDDTLSDWLRKQARVSASLGGVSGGPAILAQAGLMMNRRMTIHWDHADVLQAHKPELLIEQSRYVIDRNRLTCAGGTAALDMMHAMLTEHHGSKFARKVSDWFLHTEIQGSDAAQRAGLSERFNVYNKALLVVIELMENHIGDPMDMAQLASVAGISDRQLTRLFRQHLSQSPISFYRTLRLDKAQSLLMQSTLSVADIAVTCGFFDHAHFSRLFRQQYGFTPRECRQRNR